MTLFSEPSHELEALGAEQREKSSDLVFSRTCDSFPSALAEVLLEKQFCIVQIPRETTEVRRSVAEELVKLGACWEPELPGFEADTMGRSPGGKKVSWLQPRETCPPGLAAAEQVLEGLSSAILSMTPKLGFRGSERTTIMAHALCTTEEEAVFSEGLAVDASEIQDRIAFGKHRKVCIIYFVSGGGGYLILHQADEQDDVVIPCEESQAILFRHDLLDYTWRPEKQSSKNNANHNINNSRQLALQVWILRDPFQGETSLQARDASPDAIGALQHVPAGPLYGDSNETVDVLSLAVRDPGQANQPEDYWSVLSSGCDGIILVPLCRWDHDLYWSETGENGKGYIRHFGMLMDDQMAMFDNEFFGMSATEATHTDPPQRNCMEVGYDCLHRAGWTRESLKGSDMVASYGYAPNEFSQMATRGSFGVGPDQVLQVFPAACASRLHYVFGIRGPVSTTETACSSSLTAVALMHSWMRPTMPSQSSKAATRKQVKHGLAQGSNGHFDPFYSVALCSASMLTRGGRCFTFDQSADGFVRGEGTGAMCLRVSEKEDLARLAVLCGSCLNQDGRSASLTAPHGPSQQECIRFSLREAGIKPLDIQIQELHGTGTALGDPIEVGALRATMMSFEGVVREHPLVKTSSKSNLGHTEMCAGINGLIKCVLMGCNCSAAPNLHLKLLNPHIDDNAYPVYFNSELVDQGKETGFLGVSSFGFGGSNARCDIWARGMSGPRNTQPWKPALEYGAGRIHGCIAAFGKRTMPLPGAMEAEKDENGDVRGGLAGEYGVGSHLQAGMEYYVSSSSNGWSMGKMAWDAEQETHSFAFVLGETGTEQFQISCGGFDDLKLFPLSKLAGQGQEMLILGPGAAPAGHTWLVDGRDNNNSISPPGAVYKILLWWDSDAQRKRVSWEPTAEPEWLARALAEQCLVRHSYSLLASWTAWKPIEMRAVQARAVYEAVVRIGREGFEEFQLQRDADELQAIYPAEPGGLSHGVQLRGPDSSGEGKFWRIVGTVGDSFTIRLAVGRSISVSIASPSSTRTWESGSGNRPRYYVSGSWNKGGFSRMLPEPGTNELLHRLVMTMTSQGTESFQILADQDLEQVIHPELPQCDQLVSAAVGPDKWGAGLAWAVSARPGEAIELRLDLSFLGALGRGRDPSRAVTWQVLPSAATTT
ncbi:unnamed protein product [Polarella glacialis]|uniref:Ketosynthase family 3 (KS3) domain-containing protein n=1 Tax=Polarella glacialis TaxID=89957 RepID=A0A813K1N7_POLGL|nr:unnamed protein product [Polarella glacialis]